MASQEHEDREFYEKIIKETYKGSSKEVIRHYAKIHGLIIPHTATKRDQMINYVASKVAARRYSKAFRIEMARSRHS